MPVCFEEKLIIIQDITFEYAQQQLVQVSNCINWTLRNITARNGINPNFLGARGMFFISDAHITVYNVELYGTHGDSGIGLNGCDDFSISGSRIHDHRGDGIYVTGSTSVTIQDNILYGQTGPYADNIQLNKTSNYKILRNNTSLQESDSPKGNIIVTEGSNGLIRDNECAYGGYGVSCSDSGTVIEFNTVHDHSSLRWHSGLYMSSGLPSHDITWRYNISYRDNNGILADSSGTDLHTNIKVYNNTFFASKLSGANFANTTGVFMNNIVWCPNALNGAYLTWNIPEDHGWISDYNDIGPKAKGFIQYQNRAYDDLRSYSNHESEDTHSISMCPMFRNPETYDLTLQNNSPCINAGGKIATKQTRGPIDIGAYTRRKFMNFSHNHPSVWTKRLEHCQNSLGPTGEACRQAA